MNDYEKAKKLLADRKISLLDVSKRSKISYSTIKIYSMDPSKLKKAHWDRVNKLAEIFNQLENVAD